MDPPEKNRLPRHVAIIMDGNGRWAEARGLHRTRGHETAAESVRAITRISREMGIQALTLFAFSSENWSRPKLEVDTLMRLLNRYIRSEIEELHRNGIRFRVIGDTKRLPKSLQKLIREAMKQTGNNTDMILSVALNYGGRQDIVQAVKAIAGRCLAGEINPDDIDEKIVDGFLYTSGLPEPDLLIRTGREYRISNFLLWQLAYAELYFTDTMFPDFREKEYLEVLKDFQNRERRFGKTGRQVQMD